MDNPQQPAEAASPNIPTSAKLKAPWQVKLAGFSLGASGVAIIAELVGVLALSSGTYVVTWMLVLLSLVLSLLSILTGLISIFAGADRKGVIGKASLGILLSVAFLVLVLFPKLKAARERVSGSQQQQQRSR